MLNNQMVRFSCRSSPTSKVESAVLRVTNRLPAACKGDGIHGVVAGWEWLKSPQKMVDFEDGLDGVGFYHITVCYFSSPSRIVLFQMAATVFMWPPKLECKNWESATVSTATTNLDNGQLLQVPTLVQVFEMADAVGVTTSFTLHPLTECMHPKICVG